MKNFIDKVSSYRIDEAENVWALLAEFAAERGFHHIVYGMKSPGDAPEISGAYESTHKSWLETFLGEGQQHFCYFSIRGITSTSPFIGGLDYLPEPWASSQDYIDVAQFAFDNGLERTLAVPLTIYSSPTGLSGIAFHSDLPKDQFEANVEKYKEELMSAAHFANDWIKPWVGKKLQIIDPPSFTKRQEQVFALLVQGKQNKEIAFHLNITEPTVSFHMKEIMMRLGASNTREIIPMAIALGIIS